MRINAKRVKPEKTEFARKMRKQPTVREREVWELVRRKQLGCRIHRQKVICGYIADFWCPTASLVIEIDGPHHAEQIQYDAIRDRAMQRLGIKVMRLSADLTALVICERIKAAIG